MRISLILIIGILTSCARMNNKNILSQNNSAKFIISFEIVSKEMIKKNGKETGIYEYYARLSVQDYFIKFCESKVGKIDIEPFVLGNQPESGKINTITAEVEILEGNWDICQDDPIEAQSRIGKYMVIHKIINQN